MIDVQRMKQAAARRVLPRLGPYLRWSDNALAHAALYRQAHQKPDELRGLITRLKSIRPIQHLLEIGTESGGTFFAWCKLAEPHATLISIDLPGGSFGGGYPEEHVRVLESYARRGQQTHFLRRDSHSVETLDAVKELLAGQPLDFLMIDGDHTYDGVKADFTMYSELVRPGGLVAFHDVLPHDMTPDCQVDRFWLELRDQHTHWEFLHPEQRASKGGVWGGIGVIQL